MYMNSLDYNINSVSGERVILITNIAPPWEAQLYVQPWPTQTSVHYSLYTTYVCTYNSLVTCRLSNIMIGLTYVYICSLLLYVCEYLVH